MISSPSRVPGEHNGPYATSQTSALHQHNPKSRYAQNLDHVSDDVVRSRREGFLHDKQLAAEVDYLSNGHDIAYPIKCFRLNLDYIYMSLAPW
jgi:hypothetical protein